MSRALGLLVLALGLLSVSAARAEAPVKQADLISFGGGYMDFDKSEPRKQSADMRLEYRWGLSLLPLISPYFNSWDQYVQFHPYAGVEVTSRGAFYGSGGCAM